MENPGKNALPSRALSRRRLVPVIAAGLAALSSLRQETQPTTAKQRHKKKRQHRQHRQQDNTNTPSDNQQTGNQQTGRASPLVGPWREDVQFACGTGAEITPARPIQELYFRDDGTITVTWIPFELYYDYVGTYTADLAQGTLRFQANRGNYLPKDLDSEGHIAIDAQGRLVLTDLWLGSPKTTPGVAAGPVGCGHRFRKWFS